MTIAANLGGIKVVIHPYISRRHLLGGSVAIATGTFAPRPSHAATTLAVVDTVSGPNFQAFWKTYQIPTIVKQAGIDIKYTVGSGPPLQLQMQSWRDGEPGFSLMFLKDLDLAKRFPRADRAAHLGSDRQASRSV